MGHSEDGESPVCESPSVLRTPSDRFVDLVSPPIVKAAGIVVPPPVTLPTSSLTEEEERELAALMDELGD
jgi:hypothetical protein